MASKKNPPGRRALIVRALKSRLIPALETRGWAFAHPPDRWTSPELRHAYPIGSGRRELGEITEAVDIQVEKRNSGGLRVELSIVPTAGLKAVDSEDIVPAIALAAPAAGPGAYFVLNRFLPGWPCGFRMFDPATADRAEKRVDEILYFWSEAEEWFSTQELGPHLRKTPSI